jgi:glycosyltransferase involved in cell wall biosynthesis
MAYLMKVSVIFTTYNHPLWLAKVLWGFSAQSYTDFEIIVADDGSGEATRRVIENFKAETNLQIKHVWQEDNGFQKCRILNKAILASDAEYLIFTDGDCIPHPYFVANHIKLSAENTFLSGGYFKLPLTTSRKISKEDILAKNATLPSWLLKHGVSFTPKIYKLLSSPFWGGLLDKLTPTRATWNGHSASTWKHLILRVNGFDERMQYGGEDREFGERLVNMGVKSCQVRYRCSCVHLDHERGYVKAEFIQNNKRIRKATRDQKIIRTRVGIAELLDSDRHDVKK